MDRSACDERAPSSFKPFIAAALLALITSGCVETTASVPLQAGIQEKPARQDGQAARRASVALASFSGVSQDVADQMSLAFAQEAGAHDLELADPKKADYLVRGYLNAYPTEAGGAIAFVFDVFDAGKRRAKRLGDILFVQGPTDSISLIDSAAITKVATQSVNELAAFLGNGPSASMDTKQAEPADRKAAVSDAADDGRTIVERTPPPALPSSAATSNGLGVAGLR